MLNGFAKAPSGQSKTALYGTVGSFAFYFNGGIGVERKMWEPGHSLLNELWLFGGFNEWKIMDKNGISVVASFHALTGKKVMHIEYGLGLTYLPGGATDWILFPSPNLGVRYQKPGKSFVLRTGIGFPEIAYVSAGYAF